MYNNSQAESSTSANLSPVTLDLSPKPDFSAIKAVYFDLDDTLCTYWDASKKGLRRTFEIHQIPGKTTDEMLRHWGAAFRDFCRAIKNDVWYPLYLASGEPTRNEQMRLTLADAGIDDAALAKRLGDTYRDERDRNLELFPEAIEVLDALKAKFPLGLITNGPADVQRQEIATLGIDAYFGPVFIEGEMGEGKPNQAVFTGAAAAVNLTPSEILFVGNSYHHDIAPAIEAGWRTYWVRRPSDVPPSAGLREMQPEEIPDGGPIPDVMADTLSNLIDLLG